MLPFIFTARPVDGMDYIPLEQTGITAQVQAGEENTRRITITNNSGTAFLGVVKITLPVEAPQPRFFLPGFMYGTNRGEAPLLVDSPCPRLREKEEFPASPWWLVRSDRLAYPAALAYGGGRVVGFMAPPYFVHRNGQKEAWQPGVKEPFCQYGGFGCSLVPGGVSYTLGYENAPWMFVQSHTVKPRAPMSEENCFHLAAGESVSFTLRLFDVLAQDERAVLTVLREVYQASHEVPRKGCTPQETVKTIATAIARDAWLPENHSYACFVFDRDDHYEYRPLPSIAWTNGLAAGTPLLQAACRLNDAAMRAQAVECVEHIVNTSMNEAANLPYMAETPEGWSNRGWWYEKQRTPGHSSYLVGQCMYFVLKAYALEKEYFGTEHPSWLAFAQRVIAQTEKTRNSDGEYPYVLSDRTGAGLEYDSMSGAWCLAAAAYASFLTGDRQYLPDLLRSEAYYHQAFVKRLECYGGPLDIDKNIDSEGILAYIRAVRYLHEITGEGELLEHLKDALEYEFTFKFCYNSPIKVPPLSTVGWSSCGGSITSVTNPHIHPMSSSVVDEIIYCLRHQEDAYLRSRLEDVIGWSCQTFATFDKEYGYGKAGWMSERFCHCEGLLTEHYPDGSLASTWFALMPWAAGCILEGLAGEAWNRRA